MKTPPVIKSEQNRQVKDLASLSTRKGRSALNTFLVEGARTVEESIKAGSELRRVAITKDKFDDKRIRNILKTIDERRVPLLVVTGGIMGKISRMDSPPGIVAEVARPARMELGDLSFGGAAILACGIRDPRNIGLLVRTVAAAGAGPVIVSNGSGDPFHPVAVQTSMGAIFHQEIVTGVNAVEAANAAKSAGSTVVGTTVTGGMSVSDWLKDMPQDFLLVLGNEGAGLDKDVEKECDVVVSLPIWGNVESLNVAVSAGIFLYLAKMTKQ